MGKEVELSLPLHWNEDGQHCAFPVGRMHPLHLSFVLFGQRPGLISDFQRMPFSTPHLVTHHFNVGLLTPELEKIPVSRSTTLNEKIYAECLTISGTNWERKKIHCCPLLYHLFLSKTDRRDRGTK